MLIRLVYLAFVVFLTLAEARSLLKHGCQKYIRNSYNYIDMTMISFSWAAFAMYLYRIYAAHTIHARLAANCAQNRLGNDFVNLQYVANCDLLSTCFMAVCAACGSLRFAKILRLNRRVIVFMLAFRKSLAELSSFGLIFMIIWLGFVQVLFLLLNAESSQFATFQNAMATCFEIILGKFNAEIFYDSSSVLAPLLFVAYNVVVVFVMISLFVSILIEHYNLARSDPMLDDIDPGLVGYLRSLIGPWMFWSREKSRDQSSLAYIDTWDSLPIRFDGFMERFQKARSIFFANHCFKKM